MKTGSLTVGVNLGDRLLMMEKKVEQQARKINSLEEKILELLEERGNEN